MTRRACRKSVLRTALPGLFKRKLSCAGFWLPLYSVFVAVQVFANSSGFRFLSRKGSFGFRSALDSTLRVAVVIGAWSAFATWLVLDCLLFRSQSSVAAL